MVHSPIVRNAASALAWTGLVAYTGCAAISGLDRIQQSECFLGCDDGGIPTPIPIENEAAALEASASQESMAAPTTDDGGPLPGTDAAREAAPLDTEAGAPPATFCTGLSPPALFCEDFDEGSYTSGWSYVHTTLGTMALDKSEFLSSPGAMIAQSAVTAAPSVADVAAYRSFPATGQAFAGAVELDLRVERAASAGTSAVLAQITLQDGSGNGSYQLHVVAHSNGTAPLGLNFTELYVGRGSNGMAIVHSTSQTIALATWTHVKLSATIPAAGGSGSAALDLKGAQGPASSINVPVKNFSLAIAAGILWTSNPSNGWTVVYDNVMFNAAKN